MKISFYNLGCRANYADISEIMGQFLDMGFETARFGEPSDIVLINTCTVTNAAELDGRKYIRRARRDNPNAFIGVLGCYAQLKPGEIAEIDGVDAVFGTHEKFLIPSLIDKFEKKSKAEIYSSDFSEGTPFHSSSSNENNLRTRVVLKIQDGCDYRCTYCSIPQARGKSRSMPFDELRSKAAKIAAEGQKEIVLTGINLGDYRASGGKNFADAVRMIDNMDLPLRVRISSIEPNLLTDDILDTIAASKVFAPHFHIPLQSGSPGVLRDMKRRYTVSDFDSLIHKIKEKISHCGIGIDVICGFPTESGEAFQETYDFIENLPATYLHVFSYSQRDNTAAAEMPQIDGRLIKERVNKLRALSERKKEKFYKSQIGKARPVIPETEVEPGYWTGWTDNYIKAFFPSDGFDKIDIHNLKLNEYLGEYCRGELI